MGEPAQGAAARGDGEGSGAAAAPGTADVDATAVDAMTVDAAPAPDPMEIPPPRAGSRPEDRSLGRRLRSWFADILSGVWNKGAQDNIFFLAGAIAFNVLVAFIPLLIAVIGIAGTVLRGQRVRSQLIGYLDQVVPQPVAEYLNYGELLRSLTESSTGILSVGTLFFLWIATRLVGTLRAVLSEIFDTPETRGIVAGKIFDIKMVFMAGTLFVLNIGLSIGLRLGADFARRTTGIQPEAIPFLSQATNWWPQILAFGTIWVMFFLVYRYLPPRRIKWSTALIAATFTSVVGEALKYGFTAYVQNFASFGDLWGAVATFVILVLWIYYTSVVFILGGEVAQVITMTRIRKRQRERLT